MLMAILLSRVVNMTLVLFRELTNSGNGILHNNIVNFLVTRYHLIVP